MLFFFLFFWGGSAYLFSLSLSSPCTFQFPFFLISLFAHIDQIAYEWNLLDYNDLEPVRGQFHGTVVRTNPITLKQEQVCKEKKKKNRILISLLYYLFCLVVFWGVFSFLLFMHLIFVFIL